jgi:hypothetical protein
MVIFSVVFRIFAMIFFIGLGTFIQREYFSTCDYAPLLKEISELKNRVDIKELGVMSCQADLRECFQVLAKKHD